MEQYADAEPASWPEEALQVAMQIARGGQAVVRKRDGETNSRYASRIVALAERLPRVRLLPADADAFRQGVEEQSKSRTEFVELYEKASDAFRQRLRQSAAKWGGPSGSSPIVGGPTLHEALRDHIVWLKDEYTDANGEVTAWGRVRIKQAEVLLDRHDDLPLARLDHDAVEQVGVAGLPQDGAKRLLADQQYLQRGRTSSAARKMSR